MLYQPGLRHRNMVATVTRPPLFVPPEVTDRRSRMVTVQLVATSKGRQRIKKVDTYADLRMRMAAATTSGDVTVSADLSDTYAVGEIVQRDGRPWVIASVHSRCGQITALTPIRLTEDGDAPLPRPTKSSCPCPVRSARAPREPRPEPVVRPVTPTAAPIDRDAEDRALLRTILGHEPGKITAAMRAAVKDYRAELGQLADYGVTV